MTHCIHVTVFPIIKRIVQMFAIVIAIFFLLWYNGKTLAQ